MSASKPLIGVTTYRQTGQTGVWHGEFAMVPEEYLAGVEKAGGVALLLPPQPLDRADAERIVAQLDGLMLCGGRDVDPGRYQAIPHQTTDRPDTLRDATEDVLLSVAIDQGVPILGICRGAQMLNVHRGGSLTQHLPDVVGDTRYQLGEGVFNPMPVSIQEGTALYGILDGQDTLEGAAMYHHQAIDRVGDGLTVNAVSPDGIVEGVELEGHPFCVAVQWHPERTLDDLRLFDALVSVANNKNRTKK